MAQSKIDILVNAKDNASRQLRAVSNEVSRLSKSAGEFGRAFGVFGGIAAIGSLTSMALGAGHAAAEFNRLKISFDSLASAAGENSDAMLAAMRSASRNMISDTDLVLSANKAMMLGVANTAEEMASLIEIAMSRGAAAGLESSRAFDFLVTGLGRLSPMILDNLGYSIDLSEVFNEYAETLHKTAESLTAAEQRQALLNRVMSEGSGPVSVQEDATQRLKTAAQNAQVALGKLFEEGIQQGASSAADSIDVLTEKINAFTSTAAQREIEMLSVSLRILERQLAEARGLEIEEVVDFSELAAIQPRSLSDDLQSIWDAITGNSADSVEEIDRLERSIAGIQERIDMLNRQSVHSFKDMVDDASPASTAVRDVGAAGSEATVGLSAAEVAANSLANALSQLAGSGQAAIAGLASSLFDTTQYTEALAFYDSANAELEQMRESWSHLDPDQQAVLQNIWLNNLRDTNKEVQSTATSVAGVNQEYSRLQSTISGIISSAIGPVAGVNAEDFLPRPDAVNENARRLADIMVNGFKGQDWMDEFAREVPDIYQALVESGDPQGAAAQLLKDFQDGLVPSLIDKDRAKELARRAILGDRNAKQLADEIASELAAEMGVSFASARAAAGSALGTSDTAQRASEAITVVPRVDTRELTENYISQLGSLDIPCIPVEICPPATGEFVSALIMGVVGPSQVTAYEEMGRTISSKITAGMMSTGNVAGVLVGDIIMGLSGPDAILAFSGASEAISNGLNMGLMNSDMSSVGAVVADAVGGGFGAAFDDQSLAQYMATSLSMQIEENASMFEASGRRAAQIWGPAFLAQLEQDLPLGLINALAAEVTPLVEFSLQWRETLSNASSE
jgi:hypothetical protein